MRNRPQAKKVFSFVVDGECEIWYLQMLRKNENLPTINVEPKLPQRKHLSEQFKSVQELAKESEKVFWIIDLDHINKETREAKKGEKTALQVFKEFSTQIDDNIVIIISNPCLEFWFLLHYKQTTKYFASYAELEKDLKKYLADYQKTEKYFKNARQDIYQRLKPNLETAIKNAHLTSRFDFDNTHKGFSEMYKIFEALGLTK
jgi:hypothetical protein